MPLAIPFLPRIGMHMRRCRTALRASGQHLVRPASGDAQPALVGCRWLALQVFWSAATSTDSAVKTDSLSESAEQNSVPGTAGE
jgi:hypothetical protein